LLHLAQEEGVIEQHRQEHLLATTAKCRRLALGRALEGRHAIEAHAGIGLRRRKAALAAASRAASDRSQAARGEQAFAKKASVMLLNRPVGDRSDARLEPLLERSAPLGR